VSKAKAGTQPKYDRAIVGQMLLLELVNGDTRCLSIGELVDRITADQNDPSEVETARAAIRELRETGLITYCDDAELVEPTPAALHAHALSSTL
jgi:hypothetical protein